MKYSQGDDLEDSNVYISDGEGPFKNERTYACPTRATEPGFIKVLYFALEQIRRSECGHSKQ